MASSHTPARSVASAADWLERGHHYRAAQDMAAAAGAFAAAEALAPNDLAVAHACAQLAYETWQPSAARFAKVSQLVPHQLGIKLQWARALAGEGQGDAARAMLDELLERQPDWTAGHQLLTTLRVTAGEDTDAHRSFAVACAVQPQNLPLRLAWFHSLSMAREWDAAQRVIADGTRLFGAQRSLTLGRIFIACESETSSTDPEIFDDVAEIRDPGLDLCRVRFSLRTGDPAGAARIAEPYCGGPVARTFWPYLSLAWRLLGDERAAWLDAPASFVQTADIPLSDAELSALAATLRALHTMRAPYLEQSVRGGSQTDRHLFFNPDPIIQQLRARVTTAVAAYIANLPPPDAEHPLLGPPRGGVRYSGSWSVRLKAAGYHRNHTHNLGWISSALHISVPEQKPGEPANAGWLSFGCPPPELKLALKPYQTVRPKPARLVLFPSTMWHGTSPFSEGERLTVAFDVAA